LVEVPTSSPTAFISTAAAGASTAGHQSSRHEGDASASPRSRDEPKLPEDPTASLAAFTVPGAAQAIWRQIAAESNEPGVTELTSKFGQRLVERPRCAYLRPTIVHCDSPDRAMANREYMYPFASVVECPQEEMIDRLTLVGRRSRTTRRSSSRRSTPKE
jgi:hypothetical protein